MNFTSFVPAGLKSEKSFKTSKVVKGEGLLLLLGSEHSGIEVPLYPFVCATHPKEYGFCTLFGLKTDVDFAHFGLESGTVFERGIQQRLFLKFIENTF